MGVVYNSRIIIDGLVLCLDAANRRSYPGSGTTWYDLSGNGNHGILTNGPTYSAVNGGSIVFDGTNDYVTCQAPSVTTGLTLSLWIKLNNFTSAPFIISGKISGYSAYGVSPRSNGTYFEIRSDTLNTDIFATNVVHTSNKWENIFAVWNNGTVNMGINGIIKYTSSGYGSQLQTDGNPALWIGAFNTSTQFTNGGISLVKIYNRALSASEILQNYNATKGRYL